MREPWFGKPFNPHKNMLQLIPLIAIRLDGGTQTRVKIDDDTVSEYAEKMAAGETLPPPVLFCEAVDYWIGDGHHRVRGGKKAGKTEILADVRTGTALDAFLYAAGANRAHGLKLKPEDKRNCVIMALERLPGHSNRAIAEICHVGRMLVAEVRVHQVSVRTPEASALRVGKDGKSYPARTPHKAQPKAAPAVPPQPSNEPEAKEKPLGQTAGEIVVTPQPEDVPSPLANQESVSTKRILSEKDMLVGAPVPPTNIKPVKMRPPDVEIQRVSNAERYFMLMVELLKRISNDDPCRKEVGERAIAWITNNLINPIP